MSDPHNRGFIPRWIFRIPLFALVLLVVVYAADAGVYAVRGNPVGQVTVGHYLAVPLKGNKTEFDFQGRQPMACAQAIFPQGGNSPCWYLRGHATVYEKL